jgi:UDP-3-O-[3-hydroxymyristoyl] glucosamine N-acyltransferase
MKNKVFNKIKELGITAEIIDHNDISINRMSMIGFADEYDICYLDGPAYHLIEGKKNIFLVCPNYFEEVNTNISYIKTEDPKLLFYLLSYVFNPGNGDFDIDTLITDKYPGAIIDKRCKIGKNVNILPGAIIYKNTIIEDDVTIESGTIVGCTGLLWTYDTKDDKKIMLSTNGGVIIKRGSYISANVSIVRGACNENTIIGEGTMIAPSTAIGHGCVIGSNVHIANNVTLSGSVHIEDNCFLGSACVVQPAIKLKEGSVLGSGAILTKSYDETGVFAGIPAKNTGKNPNEVKGVPKKR